MSSGLESSSTRGSNSHSPSSLPFPLSAPSWASYLRRRSSLLRMDERRCPQRTTLAVDRRGMRWKREHLPSFTLPTSHTMASGSGTLSPLPRANRYLTSTRSFFPQVLWNAIILNTSLYDSIKLRTALYWLLPSAGSIGMLTMTCENSFTISLAPCLPRDRVSPTRRR